MAPINYAEILGQAFEEYAKLLEERQNLDLELSKKKQFIRATINMLPDNKDQECFKFLLDGFMEELGLTDAIRKVLRSNPKNYFTATEVRDKLREAKFDFSSYKANPLASVHSILKRLKPDEVEATEIDGVAAWRWAGEIVKAPSSAAFYGEVPVRMQDIVSVHFDPKKQKEAAAIRTLGRWKTKKEE